MSCRLDVKKAILKNIEDHFVKGRNTYEMKDNVIEIVNIGTNRDSKARKATQAEAIARNLVQRIEEYTNNHVYGYINQVTPYDPVQITLDVSQRYIEQEYQKLPEDQRTDPKDKQLSSEDQKIVDDNRGKIDTMSAMLLNIDTPAFLKFISGQSYGFSENGEVLEGGDVEFSNKPLLELAQKLYPLSTFIRLRKPPITPECK